MRQLYKTYPLCSIAPARRFGFCSSLHYNMPPAPLPSRNRPSPPSRRQLGRHLLFGAAKNKRVDNLEQFEACLFIVDHIPLVETRFECTPFPEDTSFKKSICDHRSESEFSMGVPVNASLPEEYSCFTHSNIFDSGFLIFWLSSSTR